MRIFLLATILFFQYLGSVVASSHIIGNVEKIDLKLKDHELAVTFIGLSNGEVTLIQGRNGENILVNTGGDETVAELTEILKLYRVKEIQTLIITNGQEVFYDQMNQLIDIYKIKELITTPEIIARITKIVDPLNEINIRSWKEGTSEQLFTDLTVEVQNAGIGEKEGLDFLLQFYRHRLFLMTSFSQRAEEILLKKKLDNVNIFKVPNGGKEDSLTERLIQYVNPQISIVYESEDNQPDPDILHDLQDIWSEVLFIKKDRAITMKFTENNYEVFPILVDSEN